jgi:ABC-type antimicrobial peptide transport system permease subunit
LIGRFSFVSRDDHLDEELPWSSLEKDLPGLIPAIADQTVIQWGLGKGVGDTLVYSNERGEPMKLLLVGGLSASVFQGSVIISEKNFLENFPSSSGSNVFLIEGDPGRSEEIASDLGATFRDLGWEMDRTESRLAEFNSVTNTYLSIFLIMGTFGMILGTIGLAVILIRNIQDRRYEFALMTATGFSQRKIRAMINGEYSVLLLTGILGGYITAVISTLPVFVGPASEVSLSFLGILTVLILLNGLAWIWFLSAFHLRRLKIAEDLRNE